MNVRVVNRLPGRPPVVDSDVERFSTLFFREDPPSQFDHLQDLGHFFTRELENARNMSPRDDERVPLADWIPVVKSEAGSALEEDPVGRWRAKRTNGHAGYINPTAGERQLVPRLQARI